MTIENCTISDMDPTLITESFRQSSPISKLADDLLQQILIRLPNPRVACLCKLVCKPWSSLISGPRFNRLFVSHHKSMSHAPMPDDPFELQSTICSFLPPVPTTVRNSLRVLDCNKDLVLCGFWDLDCRSGESSRSYLVCNPFTKQWIALPLAPMRHYPHYESRVSRLVCEPRISVGLDLGDRDRTFTYTEHRFRVVCLYQGHSGAITLDVFCSESGEWTKDAFFWGTCDRIRPRSVVSCNGELFLKYLKYADDKVDGFNPFRLDMPPSSIDVSAFLAKHRWFISNSRGGALHVIALESETPMLPARASVWRLGEDRKSWRKQCEGLMMMSSNYELAEEGCFEPFLHPHKPELVFFSRVAHRDYMNDMMCCDLGRESSEVELFAALERWDDVRHLQVFQPRVSCCWATPLIIPRCKQQPFQGVCGTGSGGFWADESMCCSSEAAAECPSLHFLNNCIDRVAKSSLYKEYIDGVISEATLALLPEIIEGRKGEVNKIIRRRRVSSSPPNYDNEWDVLLAAMNDVTVDIDAITRQKEQLKHAVVRQMAADLPYPPPGRMKSIFWREPYRGGGLKSLKSVHQGDRRSTYTTSFSTE